jgi:molybdopterin biosynthesis enzyme
MVVDSELQRVTRLTPLADVLASFDIGIAPVAAREEDTRAAAGLTLAADIIVSSGRPSAAIALRDGYALRAEATADATSYAPAPLSPAPPRIDVGEPLPAGADAVATFDAVELRGGGAQALTAVAPGEGVLAPDADIAPGTKLLLSGARLRRIDVAQLTALGIGRVKVRQPRVRVVRAGKGGAVDAAAMLIASAINAESGAALTDAMTLDAAFTNEDNDAVVAIGGTGSGRGDASVRTLSRLGKVAFHGIAIAPGETTALGYVGARPVLLLPGRVDAALAGWVTVGRRMLARLAFRLIEDQPFAAELARKIASPLGLAEVVPVRRRLGRVEPVATTGYLSLHSLTRAEGWILVPADSEGHAEGSRVVVRPWP